MNRRNFLRALFSVVGMSFIPIPDDTHSASLDVIDAVGYYYSDDGGVTFTKFITDEFVYKTDDWNTTNPTGPTWTRVKRDECNECEKHELDETFGIHDAEITIGVHEGIIYQRNKGV